MNRDAFLRDLRRYCRKTGRTFDWNPRHGKGGHGEVMVNGRFTTVQTRLDEGVVRSILKQLDLPKDAI